MSHLHKTLGIVGGMGPESTADLFLRIIRATPAERDQDHLRILIDNNPKVPDRTEAIASGNTQPVVDALIEMAQGLERAGAQVLAVPCNTAHYFLPEVRKAVRVPILDMIAEVCEHLSHEHVAKVGLLATTATIRTGLYSDRLRTQGVETLCPEGERQEEAMRTIKEVKRAGVTPSARNTTYQLVDELRERGADAIVAGCTEFSLVLSQLHLDLPVFDPLDSLARAVVRECLASGSPGCANAV